MNFNKESELHNLVEESQDRIIYIPASSLVKHIGGLILKTFPCSPPFPTRIPSSKIYRSKQLPCFVEILEKKASYAIFFIQPNFLPLNLSCKAVVSAFAGGFYFLSVTNSIPTIKPLPLTSPMTGQIYKNNQQIVANVCSL